MAYLNKYLYIFYVAGIFNGSYGSDEEYKLETELDVLLDRKQRVQVCSYPYHLCVLKTNKYKISVI